MNRVLLSEIVKHIYSNFGLLGSKYVDIQRTQSLNSKEFLLPEKMSFRDGEGKTVQNKIWGCQISVDQSEIKIMAADCGIDPEIPEYCVLVQLKNSPAYCMYFVYSDHLPVEDQVDEEALLAVNINDKEWMECGTYLQGTFLAGVEQIRDVGMTWNKCSNYQDQIETMKSFMKFHTYMYSNAWDEAVDEG